MRTKSKGWGCRFVALGLLMGAPSVASAQATCVDTTGDQCVAALVAERGAAADVDDIFQTSDGRYAPELTFGTLVRGVNGCVGASGFTACPPYTDDPSVGGWGLPPAACRHLLSAYSCCIIGTAGCVPLGGLDPSFQANSLDWYWTQVLRTDDAGAVVADGAPGFYVPERGRIYDLGGEANRVALFPISDHDPLPCEAFEYTVWLSNNPDSTVIAPADRPNANEWNLARLIRIYRRGWTRNPYALGAEERDRVDLGTHLRTVPPEVAAIGAGVEAEADALTTVWALPCGLTFRYVAIQAGNNGNPHPDCTFHSSDDELDAVAGLNEDDTGICVDADGDGHRDAACGGSDCDDADPEVHPGAFERCDATEDRDCQPMEECPSGTVCDPGSGLCVTRCFEGGCGDGFTCVDDRCVDAACATRTDPCPDGTRCREGECVAPCDGVVCPDRQRCLGGACIDPCEGVLCPTNQVCIARDPAALTVCGPGCNCTELGAPLCEAGEACDVREESPTAGECVAPGCETAICGTGETCRAGACVDACEGVVCPIDQVCMLGECIADLCASVVCVGSQVCRDGACFDACDGVSCGAGNLCRDGACVPDPCFGIECPVDQRCVEGSCIPTGGPRDAGTGGFDAAAPVDAGGHVPIETGCACRVDASSRGLPHGLLFVLALVALAWRRRR